MRYIISILFVFLLCFPHKTQELQDKQKNVCRKRVPSGVQYFCCYNHYEINDKCRECSHGTLSTDGLQCKPCEYNFYGYQCQNKCTCQRCDPVHGCKIQELHDSSTRPYKDISTSGLGISTTGDEFKKDPTETGLMLYYVIVVAGLSIAVLLAIVLLQFFQKLKRQRKSPQINVPEQIVQHNPLEESIYHEIDELSASEPATSRRNSYFSIEEINSMKTSEENTANEFLTSSTTVTFTNHTPNNELSTKKQDVDDYIQDKIDDCITSDTDDDFICGSDDDDNSDNDTIIETTDIDGYLNPYHALSTIRYKQDYE